MPIELACSALSFSTKTYPDLNDVLSRIKGLGFQYVDLAVFEGWQNIDPSWIASASDQEIESLANRLLSSGLAFRGMNTGTSKRIGNSDPDAEETLLREHAALVDFARRLSCPVITAQPCNLKSHSLEEAKEITLRQASLMADLHEGTSIQLTLEAHRNTALENPEVAREVAGALWPRVGLTYDNSHYTMQGLGLAETKDLLPYAPHIHVRTARPGSMQAPYPEGCDDIGDLMEELKARDYQGAVAIEYFAGFDDDLENLPQLKAFLEKRIN